MRREFVLALALVPAMMPPARADSPPPRVRLTIEIVAPDDLGAGVRDEGAGHGRLGSTLSVMNNAPRRPLDLRGRRRAIRGGSYLALSVPVVAGVPSFTDLSLPRTETTSPTTEARDQGAGPRLSCGR